MKYLCLIYSDENAFDRIPRNEIDAVLDGCDAYCAVLREKGTLLAAERLKPTSTATTIRLEGERASITDGPFAETKEQLGGFFLIEAKGLDEAISVASSLPPARFGCVELRPIMG
jgi:hypothetical protein